MEPLLVQPHLLRLSDTILLTIFSNLSTELYALSLLCRRLHYLALPLFIHHQGAIVTPDLAVVAINIADSEDEQIDALSALRIALFLPFVRRLVCHFQGHPTHLVLVRNIGRLRCLVHGLLFVTEMELYVDATLSQLDVSVDRMWREQWARTLGELCSSLQEKACHRLKITCPGDHERIYGPDVRPSPPISHLSNFIHWGMRPMDHPTSKLEPCFALRSISILSPSFICLPNANKKLSALSFGTIRSLILSSLTLHKLEWSKILPIIASVTSSRLSSLSMIAPFSSPADILKFVSSLPHLTSLELSPIMGLDTLTTLHHHYKLPKLTTLSAPIEYIRLLLASSSTPCSIQILTIVLPSLDMIYHSQFANLCSLVYQKFEDHQLPRLTLVVTLDQTMEVKNSLMKTLEASLSMDVAVQKHLFVLIERLEFLNFPIPTTVSQAELDNDLLTFVLPLWLASFSPRLKILSLNRAVYNTGICWTLLNPLIVAIQTHCGSIQTVELNNERHDIASFTTAVESSTQPTNVRQLPDLPDDVLNLVFEDLTSTDLYNLTILSQRMRWLALPLYLSRRGMPNPYTEWSLSLQNDLQASSMDLSALRQLCSGMILPCLDITIESNNLFFVFNYLRRLKGLVVELSAVQNVNLHFYLQYDKTIVAVNETLIARWEEGLGSLVDVIREKSCGFLQIHTFNFRGQFVDPLSGVHIPSIIQVSFKFESIFNHSRLISVHIVLRRCSQSQVALVSCTTCSHFFLLISVSI